MAFYPTIGLILRLSVVIGDDLLCPTHDIPFSCLGKVLTPSERCELHFRRANAVAQP